ncbi:MAG: NUDIX domain-containing protein [Candidatus Liptonbacteria bacterium]|nr:NUDIX domain-containing protein [Candidatus Liptonbacteria bacterium]
MANDDFAVILIKPDAPEQGLEPEILKGLEGEGLSVSEVGTIRFDLESLKEFYQWSEVGYPKEMGEYMCATPLPVLIVKGIDAIGKTMSVKERLRAKYSNSRLKNLFHCSSSREDARREYDLVMGRSTREEAKWGRTPNQVEVIVFKVLENGEVLFLMLKRNPKRGGFWQPVTGNVERGESFEAAALREVREELGIEQILELTDTGYSYKFTDNNLDQFERVFGARVLDGAPIKLSPEHTECRWVSKNDALNTYLKYPGNKEGLRRLSENIAEARKRGMQ